MTMLAPSSRRAHRSRRSLNALRAVISCRSIHSLWPGWSMFTWGASLTRSASSFPDAPRAMNTADLALDCKSYFFSDRFTIDGLTAVQSPVCSFHTPFVTNFWFYNELHRISSSKFTQLIRPLSTYSESVLKRGQVRSLQYEKWGYLLPCKWPHFESEDVWNLKMVYSSWLDFQQLSGK